MTIDNRLISDDIHISEDSKSLISELTTLGALADKRANRQIRHEIDTNRRDPAVSIVIPCYNQAQFLEDAVESVAGQAFRDWELIIVNDGSTDNSLEIARSLARRHGRLSIQVIDQPNQGLAGARNAGIVVSKGKYVLPLDADDILHPEMLQATVELLNNRQDIAIAYTDVRLFGHQGGQWITGKWDIDRLRHQNLLPYCSLYRREVWEAVGGYKAEMSRLGLGGYEDWEFWISSAENGFGAEKIEKHLFLYRVKESSMYTEALKRDRQIKALIVLYHPKLYDPELVRTSRDLFLKS